MREQARALYRLVQTGARGDLVANLQDGPAVDYVARGSRRGFQRLDQRHTGAEGCGQGARETRHYRIVHDHPENRRFQYEAVDRCGKRLRAQPQLLEGVSAGHDSRQHDEPPLLGEFREVEHQQGERRQVGAEAAESFGKLGHHFNQQNARDHQGHHDHRCGIGQRFFDLGLELFGLLFVGRDAVQHGLQGTRRLAGAHQGAEQLVELPGMLGQRGRQPAARGHIVLDVVDQFAH